jgi:hypothetical protein
MKFGKIYHIPMSKLSDKGDLTGLAEDLEAVFEEHRFSDVALGVAFTLPENRRKAHWVTNVSREQVIQLFAGTAQKMQSEVN